ncbi:SET domain-containing protein [Plenodomus tracheiphilus IPT5]|uniref:SET domain-containing protein n=1 Tax=Plenodomus tracheiphilus IPT5 TaxID=1408161 RepID=A0A6A7B9D4_9PLEO|nr:SET domain-containing protein [Plenodomus tracheiphilus IPT5]
MGPKGIGMIARQNIPCNTVIGEYAGGLLPHDEENEFDYLAAISIGHLAKRRGKVVLAHIDSANTGSVTRVLNHSCEDNTMIIKGCAGMDRRIMFVCTHEDIKAGEAITINYNWENGDQVCYCGTSKCRNPPGAKRNPEPDLELQLELESEDDADSEDESPPRLNRKRKASFDDEDFGSPKKRRGKSRAS